MLIRLVHEGEPALERTVLPPLAECGKSCTVTHAGGRDMAGQKVSCVEEKGERINNPKQHGREMVTAH